MTKVVWHGVPRDVVGHTIHPLNALRELDPALYDLQRSKYAGREETLDFRVPGLGVRFNDTVHCSPLHPFHLREARLALGMPTPARPEPPTLFTGLFYEIPLERILPHPVVWYASRTRWINSRIDEDLDLPLTPPEDEFEPFDAERYEPLAAVPPEYSAYLRSRIERGGRSLMFVHVPHVLVAGSIDVSGIRVVGWDEPPV